jgi:hypothetical protein
MKFMSSQADPDVWLQSAGMHYDMLIVYVNNILVLAKEPRITMDKLGKLYKLKPESVHNPDVYLRANMEKVQLPSGRVEWALGSQSYVENAVNVVEALLTKNDPMARLKTTAQNPFPSGYKPSLMMSSIHVSCN